MNSDISVFIHVTLSGNRHQHCHRISAYNQIIPILKEFPQFSMKSYSKMDAGISSAQYNIGLASNIAQLALSYWFDSGCESKELEDV